ncbi:MAG: nucleoside triphosphate pyrophosphohydrolase [Gemmatimonadetes bacterium]|uniref:Nucleoside triphosphate pyrophosphohydrolase n=1 Tax=Candidatus Kutchimonas denitrificans TaxID=3056748 RepID=A0AAE4Z8D9_9BACT|nr:nucleoside triphosphate pyrophosphohydrolase [Gemmatimonadota bacterium]NIR74562.1 nucleoside triphosphate pyrophosphohydrolase [Candidatus Kutchimonas denitrificans]NIS02752.1 nucleoside triphosphate pyrophosphohydrolase [Gemmatimonadota bacterium]NIT68913.1 nucleoside triphosphate pyrophosphohydrolase [Gemmatimonadota bacterium]NIU52218.1 nucleoside triphosphate pyrophosphohydrolase [Gemmatimonadota bacterium]
MNPQPVPNPGSETGVLDRALALVRFLRAGCPWDAAQTPRSLTPYLLEESLELADSILEGADAETLRSELGDLLLNVAFQIVLAEEREAFDAADVVAALEAKMRHRHPHLYGDADERPDWEAHKAAEREEADVFEGLATRLDPLARAQRVQDRAAGVGFDWEHARDALEKVREELDEVAAGLESGDRAALEAELGDLLFAAVNVARLSGLHAATALRLANIKFERRFTAMLEMAEERELDVEKASLAELDELWDEVKGGER